MTTQFRMEIDGQKKTGVRIDRKTNAQIEYFIYVAYVVLPGYKHPQAVEHYSETPLQPGTLFDVPVVAQVKDGKVLFSADYRAAKLVSKAA